VTLELLMNPSEKDHRTLGIFLRYACGLSLAPIDEFVLGELRKEALYREARNGTQGKDESLSRLITILQDMIEVAHDDPQEFFPRTIKEKGVSPRHVINGIYRLSNAMLKREWETIKQGR
jgi:hypothetical protein